MCTCGLHGRKQRQARFACLCCTLGRGLQLRARRLPYRYAPRHVRGNVLLPTIDVDGVDDLVFNEYVELLHSPQRRKM